MESIFAKEFAISPQRRENSGRAPPSKIEDKSPIITKITSFFSINLNKQ